MRTWHKEALFAATLLVSIAIIKNQPIEWLGAVAVFLNFMHIQIAFRLQEAQARAIQQHPDQLAALESIKVECHWKAQYFFVAKEACWFAYFVFLQSWSALAGVLLFLIYPLWRKYHLARKQA